MLALVLDIHKMLSIFEAVSFPSSCFLMLLQIVCIRWIKRTLIAGSKLEPFDNNLHVSPFLDESYFIFVLKFLFSCGNEKDTVDMA